jgi:hypothetical protein
MVELESCHASQVSHSHIEVNCAFRKNSRANGIQVVVQYGNISEVSKIYVQQAESEVDVPARSNQDILVSVFAIREGVGLVNYNVEYVHVFTESAGMVQ